LYRHETTQIEEALFKRRVHSRYYFDVVMISFVSVCLRRYRLVYITSLLSVPLQV